MSGVGTTEVLIKCLSWVKITGLQHSKDPFATMLIVAGLAPPTTLVPHYVRLGTGVTVLFLGYISCRMMSK